MGLRIVTLNTWKCDGLYRQRLDRMTKGLISLAPDVVLLQEVFSTLNGDVDTATHLAQALSMTAVCAPARRKPRWFEGRLSESSSGLAVLARQSIGAHRVLQLPSDEADGQRIAQLVQLDLEACPIWVANIHLTHLAAASGLRAEQLTAVMNALKLHSGSGLAVLGGDFNAGPGDPEFDGLLSSPWNLVNPFAGNDKSTHRTDKGRDMDLDHLLLSGWPQGAVLKAEVTLDPRFGGSPGMNASDHAAVLLDLEFPR